MSESSTTTAPRVSDQLQASIERELADGKRADGRRDDGNGVLMFSQAPSSNWPPTDAR